MNEQITQNIVSDDEQTQAVPTAQEKKLLKIYEQLPSKGLKRYRITGTELRYVLKIYGATQKQFANFTGKSLRYVQYLCANRRIMQLYLAKSLETFVTPEIYDSVINEYRDNKLKILQLKLKNSR